MVRRISLILPLIVWQLASCSDTVNIPVAVINDDITIIDGNPTFSPENQPTQPIEEVKSIDRIDLYEETLSFDGTTFPPSNEEILQVEKEKLTTPNGLLKTDTVQPSIILTPKPIRPWYASSTPYPPEIIRNPPPKKSFNSSIKITYLDSNDSYAIERYENNEFISSFNLNSTYADLVFANCSLLKMLLTPEDSANSQTANLTNRFDDTSNTSLEYKPIRPSFQHIVWNYPTQIHNSSDAGNFTIPDRLAEISDTLANAGKPLKPFDGVPEEISTNMNSTEVNRVEEISSTLSNHTNVPLLSSDAVLSDRFTNDTTDIRGQVMLNSSIEPIVAGYKPIRPSYQPTVWHYPPERKTTTTTTPPK